MNQHSTRSPSGLPGKCLLLCALLACLGFVADSPAQLSWTQSEGYRSALLKIPSGRSGFTVLPPSVTGVAFTNTLSDENASQNQIRLNGSGVALGDVDGDGYCDIFVCSLEGQLALYKNLGGWRFTNIASVAGLALPGNYSTGATLADIDGDGDLDLLVNGIGTGTRLFLNDGHGKFTEAKDAGLAQRFGAMTCTLADIDGNGSLDLYVANYRTNTVRTAGFSLLNVNGRRMIRPEDRGHLEISPSGRVLENGDPDVLYLNDGHGHFTPVPWNGGGFVDESGRPVPGAPLEWGLTAAFRDLNGDGIPDLYVCNDFHSPDRVWLNDGQGHFRLIRREALRHTATFSMSVDFADVDRDGRDDLLVSDMTSRLHGRRLMQIAGMDPYEIRPGQFGDRPQLDRTVLQWNRGDGTYAEIAHFAGLENSEWNWSVIFLDVDLDGYEDLLASTGHMFDTQDLDAQARIQARGPYTLATAPKKLLMLPPLREPKLAFRNRGDLTFEEYGDKWGFNQVGVSHGMALADLDNDGDLDLVVNNLNAPLGLYRNDCPSPRIAVRLKGLPPNTRGIGARVTVTGGPVKQSQEVMSGGRYLSSDEPMRVFAAGSASRLQIEVRWRSGRVSHVREAKPNCVYEIEEGAGAVPDKPSQPPSAPALFEDVSTMLNHAHHEEPFDDFQRQPLLPNRLNQLGPGVCWFDVNGDGWEDLVIGSAKGGQLACYVNDHKGGFKLDERAPWNAPVSRDQTGLVGWGNSGVLVGSATYEEVSPGGSALMLYQNEQAQPTPLIPAWDSSVGPLAMADYTGQGTLGLFVGGRVKPGRYPEAAESRLFRIVEGRLELDAENSTLLKDVGLVSGAVWTDLDADGWPELVLACEWGPVRVFHNNRGHLQPLDIQVSLTAPAKGKPVALPLSQLTGWWNGITAGDLDGDGRMDLIASNWGRNTKYKASFSSPRRLYFGDFNQDGGIVPLEACLDESGREVPDRDLLAVASGIPWVLSKFTTHESFGKATLSDVLGPALSVAKRLEAVTLDSMLFLNRASGWVAVPLPDEAQFSTAMAVAVADFDGDGCQDIFLGQNFFATELKTPRCDAGRGLWLKGDGKGGLVPVAGQDCGIAVYGEQRGVAVCDYDHDGRVDLVVTENAAATRLFHNMHARPGVRVRLIGPPGNPNAVGACVQAGDGTHWGPAQEIHAGSGYWSQDASTLIITAVQPMSKIRVRWPGGQTTEQAVPPGATECKVKSKR